MKITNSAVGICRDVTSNPLNPDPASIDGDAGKWMGPPVNSRPSTVTQCGQLQVSEPAELLLVFGFTAIVPVFAPLAVPQFLFDPSV